MLKDKNPVIYGGGGVVGGPVARAFAREGARVFLAGRTLARLGYGEAFVGQQDLAAEHLRGLGTGPPSVVARPEVGQQQAARPGGRSGGSGVSSRQM